MNSGRAHLIAVTISRSTGISTVEVCVCVWRCLTGICDGTAYRFLKMRVDPHLKLVPRTTAVDELTAGLIQRRRLELTRTENEELLLPGNQSPGGCSSAEAVPKGSPQSALPLKRRRPAYSVQQAGADEGEHPGNRFPRTEVEVELELELEMKKREKDAVVRRL